MIIVCAKRTYFTPTPPVRKDGHWVEPANYVKPRIYEPGEQVEWKGKEVPKFFIKAPVQPEPPKKKTTRKKPAPKPAVEAGDDILTDD